MNLQIINLALLASLVFILTSCGNSIFNRENPVTENPTVVSNQTETSFKQNGIYNNQNSNRLIRILEQNLSYKMNNDIQRETAFLKYNDNQYFSMYVLPDYELKVEEPTKDLLYFAEDEAISMSIELLSEDVDWKVLKESTNDQLTSLYKVIPVESSLDDTYFEDSTVQEVHNGDVIVSTYLINDPDIKLKLMMNTKTDKDHRDAFYQMAKTIMKENQTSNK